jgi:hypothetical protein
MSEKNCSPPKVALSQTFCPCWSAAVGGTGSGTGEAPSADDDAAVNSSDDEDAHAPAMAAIPMVEKRPAQRRLVRIESMIPPCGCELVMVRGDARRRQPALPVVAAMPELSSRGCVSKQTRAGVLRGSLTVAYRRAPSLGR